MNTKEKLGKRVKELRIKKRWSREDLSNLCGITKSYITGLEQGRRNVTIQDILNIAEAFDMSLAEFFDSEHFR